MKAAPGARLRGVPEAQAGAVGYDHIQTVLFDKGVTDGTHIMPADGGVDLRVE